MKTKIILFALLLITCFTQAKSSNKEFDPETNKQYWSFIKERLFDGKYSYSSKFQKNIYVYLQTECKDDSIIVTDLLKELQTLIPNKKIGYCRLMFGNEGINTDEEILLGINKQRINSNGYVRRSKNINGNQIFYGGFKGVSQPEIYMQQIYIQLNDTINFSERKRYIEYAILRSLCTIKGNPQEAGTFFPNAIFNDFDYEPYGTEFSEVDKFLLKKLYSEDFQEQFKRNLIENYSGSYYRAFLFRDQYQSIKILLAVLIILLVLGLSYKPVIFRNYKRKFISYIVISILIGTTTIVINLVLHYVASEYVLNTSFIGLIDIGGPLILSIAIASILYVMEYLFIRSDMSFNKRTLLKIVSFFIIVCIPSIILKITVPEFSSAMMINFITFGLVFGIGRGFVLYIKEVGDSTIRKKDFEIIKLKELNTNAEMQSLYAKINPHFLYNSLNSIAGLVRSNPDKTEQMAIALSDLYKYATNRAGEQTTTIKTELEMVKSYLEIEKIRFGERLNYTIQVDPEAEVISIPRNILQPLVENAIKHGISNIEEDGEIKISIQKFQEGIIIRVYDNGPAFPDGLTGGFGLQSIQDILKLYYKGEAELSWQNTPEKMAIVEIKTKSQINRA